MKTSTKTAIKYVIYSVIAIALIMVIVGTYCPW